MSTFEAASVTDKHLAFIILLVADVTSVIPEVSDVEVRIAVI